MRNVYDFIFDSLTFRAEVVFIGRGNGQDHLLRNRRSSALYILRSGRAEVVLDGKPGAVFSKPSLLFFPRAHQHGLRASADAAPDMVYAVVNFSEAFHQAVALSFPAVVTMPVEKSAAVKRVADAFLAEADAAQPGSAHLSNRLCEVMLAYLTRHAVESGQFQAGLLAAASDARIASALKAIHTRFDEDLDLDTLARDAGMSRTRFVERFRALMGNSPHNYLVNYRIGMAQQLLANRMPVKAVAERVGYATPSAFVRKFKELLGVSPGAWAKESIHWNELTTLEPKRRAHYGQPLVGLR